MSEPSDRDLLEAAARAAGLAVDLELSSFTGRGLYLDDRDATLWNPLVDDGDALRLALDLRIAIDHEGDARTPRDGAGEQATFIGPPNPPAVDHAATRRAVVRAAAALGAAPSR